MTDDASIVEQMPGLDGSNAELKNQSTGTDGESLTPEIDERENRMHSYIEERLRSEAIYKASRYSRELAIEGREEYKQRLITAAGEIISLLEIDEGIFSDRRHAEVFFTICDSWVVSEARIEAANYFQPSIFNIYHLLSTFYSLLKTKCLV